MRKLCGLTLILLFFAVGCASDEVAENPNIPAAAYAADGFTFYTAPPEHPDWEPIDFYFKHCSLGAPGNHISKTEYDCFYP